MDILQDNINENINKKFKEYLNANETECKLIDIISDLPVDELIAALDKYFECNNIKLDNLGKILCSEIIKRLCLGGQ